MPKFSAAESPRSPLGKSYEELALWERGRIRARMAFRSFFQRAASAAAQRLASGEFDPSLSEDISDINDRAMQASVVRRQREEQQKKQVMQQLTQLEGIGRVLAERLYDEFGSLESIANATLERLRLVEGLNEPRLRTLPKEVRRLLRRTHS